MTKLFQSSLYFYGNTLVSLISSTFFFLSGSASQFTFCLRYSKEFLSFLSLQFYTVMSLQMRHGYATAKRRGRDKLLNFNH